MFDKDLLREALSQHAAIAAIAAIAAKRLRQHNSLVNRMVMFASSSPFDVRPTHKKNITPIVVPTSDTSEMLKAASTAVDSLFFPGVPFYKALAAWS